MDMFQLNTFPAGGTTMKTQDFALMSGWITIARCSRAVWGLIPRLSGSKNRAGDPAKFIHDNNGQVNKGESVVFLSESNL